MAASVNDKFRIASGSTKPAVTSLSLPKAAGSTTAELSQATGWNTTTGLDYVMYRRQLNVTTGQYEEQPGTRIEGRAELIGTTLSNMTVDAGTEPVSGYAADGNTVVLCAPTAQWGDDLVSGILNFANQDGTLKASAVQAAQGIANASNTGFTPFGATMTYTGNNGSKEYTANIAADVTGFLPVGAKIAVTRGTTPPTQSMAFTAASSQYASKTSPTGITFTGALTCEAPVYLKSYPTSGMYIISRTDSGISNGFGFYITSAGQVQIFYGAGAGLTVFTSYQSVPLNKWVHLAGVVTSVSGKTASIYMNGELIPASVTGTATTMIQSGNLNIGASGTPNAFFDGYISEARIWSTAKSQAEIQANMNISLSGSETGLVFLAQGNGNFNDKTSNANHLTASGGAIATQASNPMNAIEYFKVTKVGTYSGGVTPLTLFGGTDCNLPNMTLTGAQYSNIDTPFGFPASRDKWIAEVIIRTSETIPIGAVSSWPGGGSSVNAITIPTGEWSYGFDGAINPNSSVSGIRNFICAMASSTPTTLPVSNSPNGRAFGAASFAAVAHIYSKRSITLSTPTIFRLYGYLVSVTGSESWTINGSEDEFRFFAKLAY